MDELRNILHHNPILYRKYKELVLRIKEYDKSNLEDAQNITLNHIFKKFPTGKAEIEDMDIWFDFALECFQSKQIENPFVGRYKSGVTRRRGKNGGTLSRFPATLDVEIKINSNELNLVKL